MILPESQREGRWRAGGGEEGEIFTAKIRKGKFFYYSLGLFAVTCSYTATVITVKRV